MHLLGSALDYIPFMGGYPILFDGEIIGGIAVAGTMAAEMDEVVVKAALAVLKI
jgi:glc operon protein GlcG